MSNVQVRWSFTLSYPSAEALRIGWEDARQGRVMSRAREADGYLIQLNYENGRLFARNVMAAGHTPVAYTKLVAPVNGKYGFPVVVLQQIRRAIDQVGNPIPPHTQAASITRAQAHQPITVASLGL